MKDASMSLGIYFEISGKDILKDRELMDGAEFQELEPVANK